MRKKKKFRAQVYAKPLLSVPKCLAFVDVTRNIAVPGTKERAVSTMVKPRPKGGSEQMSTLGFDMSYRNSFL